MVELVWGSGLLCFSWTTSYNCFRIFCSLSENPEAGCPHLGLWPTVKLESNWVAQQKNDLKHTSKSTSEWLKRNKIKVLEWPSQSCDFDPIKMLWKDIKQAVHPRKPSSVAKLKQFCKEEWAQISPQWCKTHCKLSQMFHCTCYCQGWHNQLLGLEGQLLFTFHRFWINLYFQ